MNYYRTNFALAQYHKWDIESIENLPPFERDIYVELIAESMKDKESHTTIDEKFVKEILALRKK